jgi:hypothetical protein
MTPYLAAIARRRRTINRTDRPTSIVALEPESENNNPLKRKWRRRQQPQRRLEPAGLLGAARFHSSLESAAPRACA